jgi:integrase
LTEESKNLAAATETRTVAGAKPQEQDIKGRIVSYLWLLQKKGRQPTTIQEYNQKLTQMTSEGVDLLNPESVQEYLAKKKWSENTKFVAAVVYEGFAKTQGLTWERPRYKPSRKLPFIPLESEVDQLIACTGKNVSALLQLLKETGMRLGEALSLKWTDLDLERNGIILNTPEKRSEPRAFRVTTTLLGKLNQLPKTQETIFHNRIRQSVSANFRTQRKRTAAKLGNPRLEKITLRTLRHFKATMEYAKTRDILHVMTLLGHKNIKNTLIYTQLVKLEKEDAFHSATAKTADEAKNLIESGFDYVCTTPDSLMLFRKRK